MARESKRILGGLTAAQVHNLSPEVRKARAAYISDSGRQISGLFETGVTELRQDHPDKDGWASSQRAQPTESLDRLLELGYQVDEDSNVYEPNYD